MDAHPGACNTSYQIVQGDTLQTIGQKFGLGNDYRPLQLANPWVTDVNNIGYGSWLNIPPCSASLGATSPFGSFAPYSAPVLDMIAT